MIGRNSEPDLLGNQCLSDNTVRLLLNFDCIVLLHPPPCGTSGIDPIPQHNEPSLLLYSVPAQGALLS